MIEDYENMTDMLFDNDTDDTKIERLLEGMEKENELLILIGGNRTQLQYAVLIEQLLDDNNFYVYEGWSDSEMIGVPDIKKYSITVTLRSDENIDFTPLREIKHKYGTIGFSAILKKAGLITFSITLPRDIIDELEENNRNMIKDSL